MMNEISQRANWSDGDNVLGSSNKRMVETTESIAVFDTNIFIACCLVDCLKRKAQAWLEGVCSGRPHPSF